MFTLCWNNQREHIRGLCIHVFVMYIHGSVLCEGPSPPLEREVSLSLLLRLPPPPFPPLTQIGSFPPHLCVKD